MKLPDPERPFAAQEEDVLLAVCVFGEARGECAEAQLAVANVVRNRVFDPAGRFGQGWRAVILRPRQFSCFLAADPNARKLLRPLQFESASAWRRCWDAAAKVYAGTVADNTGGATHYFDDSIRSHPPRWARLYVPTVKIGRLNFFRQPVPDDPARPAR